MPPQSERLLAPSERLARAVTSSSDAKKSAAGQVPPGVFSGRDPMRLHVRETGAKLPLFPGNQETHDDNQQARVPAQVLPGLNPAQV